MQHLQKFEKDLVLDTIPQKNGQSAYFIFWNARRCWAAYCIYCHLVAGISPDHKFSSVWFDSCPLNLKSNILNSKENVRETYLHFQIFKSLVMRTLFSLTRRIIFHIYTWLHTWKYMHARTHTVIFSILLCCFTDVDECLDRPCLNGGTCINNAGSYTCRCPVGYTGMNCEQGIAFLSVAFSLN